MDTILDTLQGRAFHLPEETYSFLSGRYEELISIPVNKTSLKGTHPETLGKLITLHREQFSTDEYIESRIKNPTSGTIDHLHAEIAADYALRLGQRSHLSVNALTLLQTAAHLHDIDRSFPSRMIKGEERLRHDPEGYQQFKKKHAANSSEIAKTLALKAELMGYTMPEGLLEELCYLIIRHEWGGEKKNGKNIQKPSEFIEGLNLNDLADIVKNADSISYFDANILTNWEECGKDTRALSNKVHFMFDRMDKDAQTRMRETILYSSHHILGTIKTFNKDTLAIRKVLLSLCT